jgi:hypothetical protein
MDTLWTLMDTLWTLQLCFNSCFSSPPQDNFKVADRMYKISSGYPSLSFFFTGVPVTKIHKCIVHSIYNFRVSFALYVIDLFSRFLIQLPGIEGPSGNILPFCKVLFKTPQEELSVK